MVKNMADLTTTKLISLANLTAFQTLNKAYIDAGDQGVENSLKAIIGTPTEGKTIVQMIEEAEASATYDDTQVKKDIADLKALCGKLPETASETNIVDYFSNLCAAAKKAADDAQSDVDALETLVGTIPKGASATTVTGYAKEVADVASASAAQVATDLASEVTRAKAAEKANADAIAAINDADTGILATAKGYADGKVNDLASGAVKTNTDAIAVLNGADTVEGSVAKAVKDAKDAVDAKIGTVEDGKTVVEMIASAKSEATYDDTEVRGLIKDNADAIKAHKDSIDGVVTTLVGDDTNKSVRTIANEELTKQLIPEGAKESLDTLQEIAAWIQNHPDDASAMNKAIEDLTALVGTLPEGITATTVVGYVAELVAAEEARATGVEEGLDTRLEAVETAVGEGGSVSTQITNAINALDVDAIGGEGKYIKLVSETDGKISATTGNTSEFATSAQGALADTAVQPEDIIIASSAEISALFTVAEPTEA